MGLDLSSSSSQFQTVIKKKKKKDGDPNVSVVVDVAVSDDGEVSEFGAVIDVLPVSEFCVALFAGAAVDGDGRNAPGLEFWDELVCRAVVVVVARPDLHCQWHRHDLIKSQEEEGEGEKV